MIAAAVIVLREVFEAALIVGIVLAATRGVPRRGTWIGAGIALGLLGSIAVAGCAARIASALQGMGQEVFNATVLLTATVMLGWHNVWMRRHGAGLARSMDAVGREVATGTAPLSALLLAVGLAVLREGSEVVLFLYGIAAGGAGAAQTLSGGLLGLAGGVALGAALHLGLLRIPARQLFTVTSALLLLLAAGMAAQAAGFLVQAGKLPALADPLWDSSGWLAERGPLGQLLHALAGYTERPSGMQVVFFLGAAGILGILSQRLRRPASVPAARAAALAALALAAALGLAPRAARAAHTVYSPIVEQGELALEYRGHRDFDSADARDGAAQHKLEIEYAPTAAWMTSLLGEWEKEPGASLQATEVAWENILQLAPQGKYWLDFGLLAEYAHSLESGGDDAIELGLLAEKPFARSIVTANLTAERALADGAATELEYALRWRYRLAERFEPGVELYGELGDWDAFGRLADHEHALGPSLYGKARRSGGRGALAYQAALLFGLTEQSPRMTLRAQLEYEFH
jgi:high-affinity iron transporter